MQSAQLYGHSLRARSQVKLYILSHSACMHGDVDILIVLALSRKQMRTEPLRCKEVG